MNKTTLLFEIDQNGVMQFSNTALKRLDKFRNANILKNGEVTLEIVDRPEYYQHKFYRKWILEPIAEAQGEKDLGYLHEFIIKKEFLYFEINDLRDIPEKHRRRCRVLTKEVDGENEGEKVEKVVAYIPSTAILTFEEMKKFIEQTEALRDGLTDWSIKTKEEIEEMRDTRKKAFGGV